MWLFLTVVAILIIIYNRNYIQRYAKNVKTNGINVDTRKYKTRYPTYCKGIDEHVEKFNKEYQKTFIYENASYKIINRLYSIRSDVLYQINQIKFRLPNDLDDEMNIARMYDHTDQQLMEYITDAKARLNVFVNPGNMSSAYAARHYRASNDLVV
jgi:hypothetical protein